jgi:transposase InsO family protein
VKYEFILAHREAHSVSTLCRVFRCSRSGFYNWLKGTQSQREKKDQCLLKHIEIVHERHRGHCGAVKTWRVLNDEGVVCGKHQVARIRRNHGIIAKRRRRFIVTTRSKSTHWHAPNLLQQQFYRDAPNLAWVGDVTYIPTREGHLYLAVLLDLYSRSVVGWSISNRNDVVLNVAALNMALQSRMPATGLVHHSDRGRPYASMTYQRHLEAAGMVPSMSRKGDCWDNAVAESFFATLEFELLEGKVMESREIAKASIGEFIEIFYNRQRSHQSLNYKTPLQIENVT